MLRNRPRAVSSKQALMADSNSNQNHAKPIFPSFFGSPRFKAFTKRGLSDQIESLKTPTSVLDQNNNKPTLFPFGYAYDFINQQPNPKSPKLFSPQNSEPKGIGLAILEILNNKNTKPSDEAKCCLQTSNKRVLFGTELRVQIPPLQLQVQPCLVSPTDFGTKTRNSSHYLSPSTYGSPDSVFCHNNTKDSPFIKEMELSEDYTCVISHGPNPKITHIFDNCIVENYCTVTESDDKPKSAPESFLSICHTCNKNLEQKIDIYIYRGEKAFCSQECRYQEMLLDGDDN